MHPPLLCLATNPSIANGEVFLCLPRPATTTPLPCHQPLHRANRERRGLVATTCHQPCHLHSPRTRYAHFLFYVNYLLIITVTDNKAFADVSSPYHTLHRLPQQRRDDERAGAKYARILFRKIIGFRAFPQPSPTRTTTTTAANADGDGDDHSCSWRCPLAS